LAGTDKEFVKKIKEAIDLVAFVGETVPLRRSGKYFTGLSPFTKEKSPSFFVQPEKQTWHCYSTDQGGDLLDFVMLTKSLTFREALEMLAAKANIPMEVSNKSPEQIARERALEEEKKVFYKLNKFAAKFYQDMMDKPEGGIARDYAEKRQISRDALLNFAIGYAPDSWTSLRDYFLAIKAPMVKSYELGLFRTKGGEKPKEDGSNLFDTFRNRLIFPIRDVHGEVLGFGGRWLGPSNADAPKYLNSPESLVYEKDKTLYNLDQARKPIRDMETVVLVEGYMDCLSLVQAGFPNVVANCGTALTKNQAIILRKLAPKVICLYDSDAAGQAATEKAMNLFLETDGYPLLGARLPDGKDPDEFLKSHGDDGMLLMANILSNSPALLDTWIDKQIADTPRTLQARTETADRIAAKLSKLKDDLWIQARLPGLATGLDMEPDFLFGAIRKYKRGFGNSVDSGPASASMAGAPGFSNARPVLPPRPSYGALNARTSGKGKQNQSQGGKRDVGFDRRFLGDVLKNPSWIAALREQHARNPGVVLPFIQDDGFKTVLAKILEPLPPGQGEDERIQEALEGLRDQPRLRSFLSECTMRGDDGIPSNDLEAALTRLRDVSLKIRATALQAQIDEAERSGDGARSEALLLELLDLRRQRAQR
jgi:DNA primase